MNRRGPHPNLLPRWAVRTRGHGCPRSPHPTPPLMGEKRWRFMESPELQRWTRIGAMNRTRCRQSALISFAGRWRGLTSAATRFMEWENLKLLTRVGAMKRHAQRRKEG